MKLSDIIKRLETVSYRLKQCQRGKDWTRRSADADVIDTEILPVLAALEAEQEKTPTDPQEARVEYARAVKEFSGSDESMYQCGFAYGVIVGKRSAKLDKGGK